MAKETIAWCWASGLIEFGHAVPEGAIEIAYGKDHLVRNVIAATSRVSRDNNKTLLVPGVAEAPNQKAAAKALSAHLRWLKKRACKGFRVTVEVSA